MEAPDIETSVASVPKRVAGGRSIPVPYEFSTAKLPGSKLEDIIVAGGLDGRVYAIDAWTGNMLWTFDSGGPMVDSSNCGVSPPQQQSQRHERDSSHRDSRPEPWRTTTVNVDGGLDTMQGKDELSIIEKQRQSTEMAAVTAAVMAELVPSYNGRLYHLSKSSIKELEMTMVDIINANGPVRLVDEGPDGESLSDIILFGEKRTEIFTLDASNGLIQPYYPVSPTASPVALSKDVLFGRSEFKTRAVHARNSSSTRCFKISEYFLQFTEQSHCTLMDDESTQTAHFPPDIIVLPKDPDASEEDEGSTITAYDPWTNKQLWEVEIPHFDVLAVFGISTTRGSTFYKWKVDGPSSNAFSKSKNQVLTDGADIKEKAKLPGSPTSAQHSVDSKREPSQPLDDADTSSESKQLTRVTSRSRDSIETHFRLRLLGNNYYLEPSSEDVSNFSGSESPSSAAAFHESDNNGIYEETQPRRKHRVFWKPIVNEGKRGVFITYYHVGAMMIGVTVGSLLIAWGCYVKGLSASIAHNAIKGSNQFFMSHVHQLTIERPGEESITISSVISRPLLMSAFDTPRTLPLLENGDSTSFSSSSININIDPATEAELMDKFARMSAIEAASALVSAGYSSTRSKVLQVGYEADSTGSPMSSAIVVRTPSNSVSLQLSKAVPTTSPGFDVDELDPSFDESFSDSNDEEKVSPSTVPPEISIFDRDNEHEEDRGEVHEDPVADRVTVEDDASVQSSEKSEATSWNSNTGSNLSSDDESSSSAESSAKNSDTSSSESDHQHLKERKGSDASSSDSSHANEAEVLFPFVCQSRFANEFEEISAIGKGGFGQVILAENRLDGRKYAIKRVGLHLKNQTSKTLQKFLREVKILALLDHPNIVRYYQAWLEKVEESSSTGLFTVSSDLDSSRAGGPNRNYSMSNLLAPISEMEFSDNQPNRMDFYSNGGALDDDDDGGFMWERDSSSELSGEQVWREEDLIQSNNMRKNRHQNVVAPNLPVRESGTDEDFSADKCDHWLFIQMQYCAGRNLGDYLVLPNRPMELPKLLRIFVQIASALAHVHSCGLIHRDLKPANIFVADTEGDSIKLGDFGLSRYAANVNLNGPTSVEEHHQELSASVTTSTMNATSGQYHLHSTSIWSVSMSNVSESNEVTAGVGTYLYASPEQVAGKKYNAKTDVYSLGMILFELCHERFTTTMERYIALRKARENAFPPEFKWNKRCPELMEMIAKLLSHDPAARPSAEDVVKWVQDLYETSLAQQAMAVIRSPSNMARPFGSLAMPSLDLMGSGAVLPSTTFSFHVEAQTESCGGENGPACGERRLPNHNLLKEICDVIGQVGNDRVEIKKCGLQLQDGVQILEFVLDAPPVQAESAGDYCYDTIVVAIEALPGHEDTTKYRNGNSGGLVEYPLRVLVLFASTVLTQAAERTSMAATPCTNNLLDYDSCDSKRCETKKEVHFPVMMSFTSAVVCVSGAYTPTFLFFYRNLKRGVTESNVRADEKAQDALKQSEKDDGPQSGRLSIAPFITIETLGVVRVEVLIQLEIWMCCLRGQAVEFALSFWISPPSAEAPEFQTSFRSMKTSSAAYAQAVLASVFALATTNPASVFGFDILQHGLSANGNNCLQVRSDTSTLMSSWCSGSDDQLFDFADRHTLRIGSGNADECLQFFEDNSVRAVPCTTNAATQQWRARYDGSLAATGYTKFGKCLTANSTENGAATLQACSPGTLSQVFRSSVLVADTSDVLSANGVCLNFAGGTAATTLSCHGGSSQLWAYSFDDEIRNADSCLEYDKVSLARVSVVKCSGSSAQKWLLDSVSGKVTPSAQPSRCLDFTNYAPVLVVCGSPLPKAQVFNANVLLSARDRNLRRTMIQAPGIYTGNNCVTVNRATKDVHIAPCSRNVDMWWEITSAKTMKLAGEQCIDLSTTENGRVTYNSCNGKPNQQWSWNATTGTVASVAQPDRCLTFITVNVTGWENIKFSAQTCGAVTLKALENQVLRARDFSDILPSYSRADAQQSFCSQRSQRPNDLQFLRDTLFWSKKDVKALVPTTLSSPREEYNYYTSVVLESLSAVLGTDARLLTEGEIADKLSARTNGVLALFDLSELMCKVRERDAELHLKITGWLNISSKPTSERLIGVVNYLRMANLQLQLAVLPLDSALLGFVSDHIATSINDALRSHLSNNDLKGLNAFVSSSDMSWFVQVIQPLCTARPRLAVCSATYFPGLILARQDLLDEIATSTNASLKTNELVTLEVLSKADTFMQIFHEGLASGSPVDATVWQSFVQLAIFGAVRPITLYPPKDLLHTTSNSELMMILTLWPYFTTEEMSSAAWGPFFTAFSDQFYDARRLEIQRIVYSSRVQTLEAYFDGRSSDMNTLATQILPRVCTRFPAFRACLLTKFHALTNARAELQRRVMTVGKVTGEVLSLAEKFATVFGTSAAQSDDLWTTTAVRLLFSSVELQIYSAKNLLTTATPGSFLMLYTVFTQYSNAMAPLLPYFTFLSDQVSAAHFSAINTLIADRNVDGMVVYVDPLSNSTTSDLGVFGESVLPLLCNNPNNPEFSVCKLQDFHSGLRQVIVFEKSRRARTVSLVDVAEVDVRKQLDVIDGESKQFEIITTIQDAANQIGQKVQEESEKIQATVATESAFIRADIAASTQALYEKMGDEGRALQATIEASSRELEDTIGAAADVIRQEIADNTQLLYEKMDDEARALQNTINENTQKLSTQIGAEAQATRKLVNDATSQLYNKIGEEGQAIRGKIDESTSKLYNKIGEESQAIRTKIDQSTDKLYNKIGEEGQKTRDKVDESRRQLTTVINTNAAKLESKVASSTSTIMRGIKTGFKDVGDVLKPENVRLLSSLTKSHNAFLVVTEDSQLEEDIDLIDELVDDEEIEDKGAALVATAMRHCMYAVRSAVELVNPVGALIEDPRAELEIQPQLNSMNTAISQLSRLPLWNNDLSVSRFAASCSVVRSVTKPIETLKESLGESFSSDIEDVLGESDSSLTASERTRIENYLTALYDEYEMPFVQKTFLDIQESARVMMIFTIDTMAPKDRSAVKELTERASRVFSKLVSMFGQLSRQYEELGKDVQAASQAWSASRLLSDIKKLPSGRRLQSAASTFKPIYAMAYAGLTKLFMQYKVQQAALQFCKFYEYKLGGTAPSMCGSSKYYTPEDIQLMRAYQPPTYKSTSLVAYLPTKPSRSSDDTNILSGPYLDLESLLLGKKVLFSLPVDDIGWLKQYKWVIPTETETSLAGAYIQSMQIMWPVTINDSSSTSLNPFTMVSTVDISMTQQLNARNNKTFVLPSTRLQFSASINEPACPATSEIMNPYHQIAKCVKSDDTSRLCVYEDSEVSRTDLLPSLFSQWEISMPRDGGGNTGKGYNVALPSVNGADTVDLNVVVLLKIVRVASTSASTMASAATEAVGITADPFFSEVHYAASKASKMSLSMRTCKAQGSEDHFNAFLAPSLSAGHVLVVASRLRATAPSTHEKAFAQLVGLNEMVLFTEAETMLLLDIYLHLRTMPQNVTTSGVLLKVAARDELTRALNKSAYDRDSPWTDGQGLSDEWWSEIKAKRPKAHVFKGKLPWPFAEKMAIILCDVPYRNIIGARNAKRIRQLLHEDFRGAEPVEADILEIERSTQEREENDGGGDMTEAASTDEPLRSPLKRNRDQEELSDNEGQPNRRKTKKMSASNGDSPLTQRERQESLTKSVEQCSTAAAGMARGFQELVGVFQVQADKYRETEISRASESVVQEQRQVLLSIAKSLEQSTRATADMARGYHDLIQHFIRESNANNASG
ncbi:Pek protein kinase, partial [Globisporangium splendens]